MARRIPAPALGAIVLAEVVVAIAAWRDLNRRPAQRVRGGRTLWRIVICANPGNALAYWLFGRR